MYNKPYLGQIPDLVNLYAETFGVIDNGCFVDIGAFDCRQWSNTFTLAQAGWRGVMVEPQPDLAASCRELLQLYPKVQLVQKAVAIANGVAKMRLAGSLSTIDSDQIERYRDTPEFAHYFAGEGEFIDVEVTTADTVMEEFGIMPGFEVLSIDVEGSELAVLDGFSIDIYEPKIVIVEVHEGWHPNMAENARAINLYFEDAGYEKIYSDYINNVYR